MVGQPMGSRGGGCGIKRGYGVAMANGSCCNVGGECLSVWVPSLTGGCRNVASLMELTQLTQSVLFPPENDSALF